MGMYISRVRVVREILGRSQQQFVDEGFAPSLGWVRDQEQGRGGLSWLADVWMTVVELSPDTAREAVAIVRSRKANNRKEDR